MKMVKAVKYDCRSNKLSNLCTDGESSHNVGNVKKSHAEYRGHKSAMQIDYCQARNGFYGGTVRTGMNSYVLQLIGQKDSLSRKALPLATAKFKPYLKDKDLIVSPN